MRCTERGHVSYICVPLIACSAGLLVEEARKEAARPPDLLARYLLFFSFFLSSPGISITRQAGTGRYYCCTDKYLSYILSALRGLRAPQTRCSTRIISRDRASTIRIYRSRLCCGFCFSGPCSTKTGAFHPQELLRCSADRSTIWSLKSCLTD